jgi:hypothetical protein
VSVVTEGLEPGVRWTAQLNLIRHVVKPSFMIDIHVMRLAVFSSPL